MNDPKTPDRSPFRGRPLVAGLAAVGLAAAGVYFLFLSPRTGLGQPAEGPGSAAGAGKKAGPRASIPVASVTVGKADIPVYLEGLGSVAPLSTVTVKSRVDGQLLEVRYEEGQAVKAGDLLAVIDPRPFQVQLLQAEGQLARDEALQTNAGLELERLRKLFQEGSSSRQELDTAEAAARQYEGAVKADRGAVESARLQLEYSRIVAPLDGRIGLRLVDPGNIVRASDATGLATIVQFRPIAVIFTIPEGDLFPVLEKVQAGERLAVEAWDRERKRKLAEGVLRAVDNRADPSTGTVRLKAEFPNDDGRLFPNGFVNARLLVEVRRGILVVPSAAIQRGPQGAFVYVVKADRTVSVRPVALGGNEGGRTAVESGLEIGEEVVVDGTDRLREGAAVELRGAAEASRAPGSPEAASPGGGAGKKRSEGPGSRKPAAR